MLPSEICQSRTSSAGAVARKGRIRVFRVDDHILIREGIVVVINGQTEMQAVAQVSTGHERSSRVRDHEATTGPGFTRLRKSIGSFKTCFRKERKSMSQNNGRVKRS